MRFSREVSQARSDGRAVVALESSVLAQGLAAPHNAEAARRMDLAIRAAGAVPAITAVVAGEPCAGLEPEELARFLDSTSRADKASARDLSVAIARRRDAATTVAGALVLCHAAGIPVFATGGIGGVHRAPAFDESADLIELARTPMIVVCAGAKSVLDLPATAERLESLGVTVLGYQTGEFPGFHYANTGIPVPSRVTNIEEIVDVYHAQRSLGHPGAILVVQPPPPDEALPRDLVEAAITQALEAARVSGVRGAATTPWLLSELARVTGGRTIRVNLALLDANARLAAEIAVQLARR
ncbi:MAG TPA: pseudouridine-5'-phosphate glycosidase [Gemmatimonadaceae bacterium]